MVNFSPAYRKFKITINVMVAHVDRTMVCVLTVHKIWQSSVNKGCTKLLKLIQVLTTN